LKSINAVEVETFSGGEKKSVEKWKGEGEAEE